MAWLDGFIERQRVRQDVEPDFFDRLTNVLGSYLGECIIRCYGGRWELHEAEGWGVRVSDRFRAFPFAKVSKQFANGREDSIESFFTMIPIVAREFPDLQAPVARRRRITKQARARRPWWQFWK